mmetsp:Transcript_63857/g.138830  ORF Transcript_63857/g.138830 Transcript_63857/m.138830 type:complete len:82 (+) Transcript_63857:99-344(+)
MKSNLTQMQGHGMQIRAGMPVPEPSFGVMGKGIRVRVEKIARATVPQACFRAKSPTNLSVGAILRLEGDSYAVQLGKATLS